MDGRCQPIAGLACGLATITSRLRYVVCLVAIATFMGEGCNFLGFHMVPSHLCKVLTSLIVDRIYFNVVVVCDGEVGLTTGETIVWVVGSTMTWPKSS